jgi:hypothetical protein
VVLGFAIGGDWEGLHLGYVACGGFGLSHCSQINRNLDKRQCKDKNGKTDFMDLLNLHLKIILTYFGL